MLNLFAKYLSNWQAIVIGAVLLACVSFGIGWHFCSQSWKADKADELQQAIQQRDELSARLQVVSKNYQDVIAKLDTKDTKINTEWKNETAKHPELAGCVVSDGMQQLINAAVADTN